MEDKSYSQMKQEFREFYFNEVKPKLPEYTKMRRAEGPMQIAFFSTVYSFGLVFAFAIWFEFVSKVINTFSPMLNIILNTIARVLLGIDIVVCIISVISLITISLATLNSSNTHGNTLYIKQDLEMALKNALMPKFVNIFFNNGFWYKKSMYNYQNSRAAQVATQLDDNQEQDFHKYYNVINEYNKILAEDRNNDKKYHIKNLRKQILLNPYPWERYDDIMWGRFKDVNIKIYDVNTEILRFSELIVVIFLYILLSAATAGVFIFVSIPVILFFLLIFIFKIFQYSLFRGAIIEFDMNKKFSGHTFFHENSSTAKKIPFNKKTYQKVNLESTTFEDKYNVYSDNQVEARYILTPAFMERIENMKFAFKAKYVRGSFKDNKLTLAIHTGKDMFAMGSDFKDSDTHTFEILYDEMISVLQIVDELKLNEHTGL